MQSFRKYVEHVGLTGSTVNSSTRSIVAEGWVARSLISRCSTSRITVVHPLAFRAAARNYLGTLPRSNRTWEQERPPFRTFGAALHDLFIILPIREWVPSARSCAHDRQELAKRGLA